MIKAYFLWLLKFITVVIVLLFVVPGCIIGLGSAMSGAEKIGGNKIAVVELSGVIYDSREVVEELYRQAANTSVDGIVLRIDSPGGAVAPSQEIYSAVSKLKNKKPIVASMGSVAASGGLYASLGASKVFAQPGTLTGSIGVIMELPNLKQVADKVGVTMNTIKSGQLKDVGNMFRDMTPEERAYLEDVARKTHAEFIDAVATGRKLDPAKVRTFADGRVLVGQEAIGFGLVDKMGDVYDAGREIYEILGKPLPAGEEVKLFYPQDKFKEFKDILRGASNLVQSIPLHAQVKYLWR